MQKNQLMAALAVRGTNLTELADKMGIPVSTLYLRVADKQPIKYPEMVSMKRALVLTPKELALIFPELLA